MRHGPAEDVAGSGRDFDRALTAAGRTRVARVAEVLKREGEIPATVWTSPLVRAKETAALVAAICGLPGPPGVAEALAAGSDGRAFLDGLLEVGAGGDASVMLVGHEPDMTELLQHALRDERSGQGFDKAEVVVVAVTGAARRLERTLDPRELRFR